MKLSKLLSLILAAILLTGCAVGASPTMAPQTTPAGDKAVFTLSKYEPPASVEFNETNYALSERVSDKLVQFNYAMAEYVAGKESTFVLSPFSAYIITACLSNGATGDTKTAMQSALYPQDMTQDEFNPGCQALIAGLTGGPSMALETANLICVDNDLTLKDRFAKQAAEYFYAKTAEVDFQNPDCIDPMNDWVNEKTHGLIDKIFDEPLDAQTVAVLLNSVYFASIWSWKFDAEKNEPATFHGLEQDQDGEFMVHEGKHQSYFENNTMQAITLNYESSACMKLYLPKDGYTVTDVIAALGENGDVAFSDREGTFKMPKFSTDFKIDLKDTFKALGLGAIFTGTINDLVDSFEGDVFVSDVLQKAHIEVDEEGTKAAAVTAEIMAGTGMPLENDDPPFEMILDHPFVYVIEVGGTPIFIGAVSAL